MKILIVDDQAELLEMLELALKNRGHDVVLAPNTRMAREAIDANPDIGMMLADLKMEGDELRGFQSVEYAKNKLTRPLQIYLIVASLPPGAQETADRLGVKDMIFKPFSLQVFFQTIGL